MDNGSEDNRGFLCSGIAFPLSIKENSIELNLSEEDHIRQSILLILNTVKGERVMRPNFGCGLDKFAFSGIGAVTKELVKHEIEAQLIRFEPRIQLLSVDVNDESRDMGTLFISLEYRVFQTDTISNMVYTFNLEKGGV